MDDAELVLPGQDTRRPRSPSVPAAHASSPPPLTHCFVHSLLERHIDLNLSGHPHSTSRHGRRSPSPHFPQTSSQGSRLLTKQQMADLAFGVREFAKKLAHITVQLNVHRVFVLCKAHDKRLVADARQVAHWLLEQDKGYRVCDRRAASQATADRRQIC